MRNDLKNQTFKYYIRLITRFISLILAIIILTFTLVEYSPLNPYKVIMADAHLKVEQKEVLVEKWGLKKPISTKISIWINNASKGDLGESLYFNKNVVTIIKDGATNSFVLMLTSWVLTLVIGVVLGILMGLYKDSLFDNVVKGFAYLFSSTPSFWVGILILLVFAVHLKLFPTGMAYPIGKSINDVTLSQRIHHMVLPCLTLTITSLSNILLHTRTKIIETLQSDYALYDKARGYSDFRIILRHGIRNILLPIITFHFSSIGELFGGSTLTETVFSYPGLGSITVLAGIKGDVYLLLGVTIIMAIFVFSGNLIADILYPLVDPRIKEVNI